MIDALNRRTIVCAFLTASRNKPRGQSIQKLLLSAVDLA